MEARTGKPQTQIWRSPPCMVLSLEEQEEGGGRARAVPVTSEMRFGVLVCVSLRGGWGGGEEQREEPLSTIYSLGSPNNACRWVHFRAAPFSVPFVRLTRNNEGARDKP